MDSKWLPLATASFLGQAPGKYAVDISSTSESLIE